MNNTAITAMRILGVEAITKAKSGHPGIVLGAAPILHTLVTKHLNVNPNDDKSFDRDLFILSAGHGSALLYSAYHLMGFDISIDDLKNFRQTHSKTPGHPEVNWVSGVDATTGPLGQGITMGVGMAVAEEFLASKFNTKNLDVVNHYTYVICGDGDLQEGVCQEAMSFAGHQKLGKLIVLYDSNDVQLDGFVNMANTENVKAKYESMNWNYILVKDGNNIEAIDKAIIEAKSCKDKPSIIEVKTVIGFGAPGSGTSAIHGKPLNAEQLQEVKKFYNWNEEAFTAPQAVYDLYKEAVNNLGVKKENEWNKKLEQLKVENLDLYNEFVKAMNNEFDFGSVSTYKAGESVSTRVAGGKAVTEMSNNCPYMIGGSADLTCSTMIKGNDGNFEPTNRQGRNINFGVREFAMGAIANGMNLHGGVKSFTGAFFVFSDYMKPAMRLAAIMKVPTVYAFSHDTIAVGEDGPTHQPVEQLLGLRAVPNLLTFRPADANETVYAYQYAFNAKYPSAVLMTRQNLPVLENTSYDGVTKGAYVISEAKGKVDGILLATGSEVSLAIEAQKELANEGINVRVVSMPSTELFDMQPKEYKEAVLPKGVFTLAIEMGSTLGWYKYADEVMGIDKFGISSPLKEVVSLYGFNVKNVIETYKNSQK